MRLITPADEFVVVVHDEPTIDIGFSDQSASAKSRSASVSMKLMLILAKIAYLPGGELKLPDSSQGVGKSIA